MTKWAAGIAAAAVLVTGGTTLASGSRLSADWTPSSTA